MNTTKLTVFFSVVVLFTACNTSTNKQKEEMTKAHEHAAHDSSHKNNGNVKEISPTFTNVDAKTAAAVISAINKYLDLKNALATNDESVAQENGKELYNLLSAIDKSLLTPQQTKIYESEEEDLKENAEHIGKSKIEHQRMHFSILSESIYVIAKSFGGGRPLYHFFCSRAEEGKGAMWLSEMINNYGNPYLGNDECTEVVEKIK